MSNLVHSNMGLVHLIFSMVACITGAMVLAMQKGTRQHKQIGYVYFISMIGVNGTAFTLYQLFGGFGIFHYGAILSLLTVAAGMIPAYQRKNDQWILTHFSMMYWSVVALYGAFFSETITRVFHGDFFISVGLATGVTLIIGGFFFGRLRGKWYKQFSGWK